MAVAVVGGYGHRLLIDAADGAGDGSAIAVVEDDPITDLEVGALGVLEGRPRRCHLTRFACGVHRLHPLRQIDGRIWNVRVPQIERRLVDHQPAILHRHDAPGMDGNGVAAEKLHLADQEAWLHGSPEQVFACLKPYEDELTIGHKVSARVTSPKNNDAKLVEEVAYRGSVESFAQSSIHQHSPR